MRQPATPRRPRPLRLSREDAVPAAQSLDLATLLWLVDGQNPQVALARERIAEAYAQSRSCRVVVVAVASGRPELQQA